MNGMGWNTARWRRKDLFASKLEATESNARDRKLSSSSSGSMKSKWLKAIKSLKTTSGPTNNNTTQKDEKKHQMYHAVSTIIAMRKTGRDGNPQFSANTETAHQFQEYTYKKITPCDFCSQVLRGHTRQGLKCRVCKMNVHLDCQEKVTTRCQVKSRLLRRQKSTSEIETKMAAMNVAGRDDDEAESHVVGTSSASCRLPESAAPRRRRLFGGVKSFTMFGGRSQTQGRSISLPEKQVKYAAGTRPFGQPLVLPSQPLDGDLQQPVDLQLQPGHRRSLMAGAVMAAKKNLTFKK